MLAYEWRELEVLCDRISDLRHRQAAAKRSQNSGLIEGLNVELALAQRQRELLVRHISARLGGVAAERSRPPHAAAVPSRPQYAAAAEREPAML